MERYGRVTQTELEKDVQEILIDEAALQARIVELGVEISADYAGRDLLLVGVLKGAVFFLADLQFWLANFGLNLDPNAALSSSVDPFIPPVLWQGTIAQFSTVPRLLSGFWLSLWASGLILVGLFFHRRAYKPLVDKQAGNQPA